MWLSSASCTNWILTLILAICVGDATAGLSGHTVRVAHVYDPVGEVGSFEGYLDSEIAVNLFEGWYTATVRDDGFSIEWRAGKIMQGLYGFNGFVLTIKDRSPITSATIAESTTWPAFSSGRLSFDGSHVWADFGYLSSMPTQRLDVTVLTAVPEMSTIHLMTVGLLCILLLAFCRRIYDGLSGAQKRESISPVPH